MTIKNIKRRCASCAYKDAPVTTAMTLIGGVSMEEHIFVAVTLLIGFFFGFLCGRSGT